MNTEIMLLLRFNYGNHSITHSSTDHVKVKTEDNSDWEHLQFDGFITYTEFTKQGYTERKVACNGWRATFNDSWIHIDKSEYVVGSVQNNMLKVVLKGNKPYIKSDSKLSEIKARPKASVTKIY